MELEEAREAVRDGRARAFRRACGLSLREAATLVGVTPMTCWRWEAQRVTPPAAVAKVYVEALLAKMAEDAA